MTVSELIARLQQLSPDAPVVLASDSEGNEFHPLVDAEGPYLVEDMGYYIESVMSINYFDNQEDYEDSLSNPGYTEVVILWP